MKKSNVTETQIIKILQEQESGISVKEIARKHGISEGTFYSWKSRYGGMEVSELKRIKDLEEENRRLKKLYANLSLEHDALKDVLEKKPWRLTKKDKPSDI